MVLIASLSSAGSCTAKTRPPVSSAIVLSVLKFVSTVPLGRCSGSTDMNPIA